jgi:hypothetical protein
MTYHRLNGKSYTFKTEYITKIIDYGRNYFNNGKTNTAKIIKKICYFDECEPDCGEEFGYNNIKGVSNGEDFYWINPIEPNVSHDLRAVQPYSDTLTDQPTVHSFVYAHKYGTPQSKGYINMSTAKKFVITNIFNLRDALESIMEGFNSFKNNKKYDNTWKVAATMNIYEDGRDYEFVVLPDTV